MQSLVEVIIKTDKIIEKRLKFELFLQFIPLQSYIGQVSIETFFTYLM